MTTGTPPAAPAKAPHIPPSKKINADLDRWGYEFTENSLDGTLYCNGAPLTDGTRAILRMRARDAQYGDRGTISLSALDDAIRAIAHNNQFHPVQDYLTGLSWDGDDHIGRLAAHFQDAHPPLVLLDGSTISTFHAFLRRWLFGAVAKVFGMVDAIGGGAMLVLDGAQGRGKSHFCRWLCPLPDFFNEEAIRPDSEELPRAMASTWIWEVSELGATTSKADIEALKATLTRTQLKFRTPYAKDPVTKRPMVSWLGTLNSTAAGWLRDQTGNRRFLSVTLTDIDWSYSQDIDVHQVWAQAVATWRQNPDSWQLTTTETVRRDQLNAENTTEDPFVDALQEILTILPGDGSLFVATADIRQKLQALGFRESADTIAKRVAIAAKVLGLLPGKHPVSRRNGYKGATLIV